MPCDFYFISIHPDLLKTFYASIHLKLYTSLLPGGRMNSKTKINIYKKVIKEVYEKFEGALEFINNKVTELCFQEGISTEEVRLYIF